MPTLTAPCAKAPGLAVRLRNWSAGYPPVSAGVELLITHDYWLHQPDFVNACVDVFEALDDLDGITPMAIVLWNRVPGFLDEDRSPGRARRVLRMATKLAGADTATPLADLVANLPDDTVALVLDAIAHHWDQRHTATGQLATHTPVAQLTDRDRPSAMSPGNIASPGLQ